MGANTSAPLGLRSTCFGEAALRDIWARHSPDLNLPTGEAHGSSVLLPGRHALQNARDLNRNIATGVGPMGSGGAARDAWDGARKISRDILRERFEAVCILGWKRRPVVRQSRASHVHFRTLRLR